MAAEMKVGSIFETESGQLRQVVGIATDDNSGVRISYISKSAKIIDMDFIPEHTKTNLPLDAFKKDSGRLLTDDEIRKYVGSGILKSTELFG